LHSFLVLFLVGKNKQMNEQYHTVNTWQWKRDHLPFFLRIFAVVNVVKTHLIHRILVSVVLD